MESHVLHLGSGPSCFRGRGIKMIFTKLCVMLVVWGMIMLVTALIDMLSNDDGQCGWFLSAAGFAICLVWLLADHGLI